MKYFSVGPSELYPTCIAHYQKAFELQIGSISHRSEPFRAIYKHTDTQLRTLLNIPPSHKLFFTNSASEIWERSILNLVKNSSFHFIQGAFSKKYYEYALALGKKPEAFEVPHGQGFEVINEVSMPNDAELICTTQNETSSGIRIQEQDLKNLKLLYPDKLICTDIVSAVPYSTIDFQYMDMAFFSVQKGMGMPPGLGVWIANDACIERMKELKSVGLNVGAHFTLESFEKNYAYFETPSTPNTIAIYVLGKIAEDMNSYGIQKIRTETETKFEMLYEFISASEGLHFDTNIKEHLSRTVCVANSTMPAKQLNEQLKSYGMQIASGYGNFKNEQIRIANFPSSTIHEMDVLIKVLKEVLK